MWMAIGHDVVVVVVVFDEHHYYLVVVVVKNAPVQGFLHFSFSVVVVVDGTTKSSLSLYHSLHYFENFVEMM